MSIIYIHVGTPKTGTSAIQAFCDANQDALHQFGFDYPKPNLEFPGISPKRNAHFYNYKTKDAKKNRLKDEDAKNIEIGVQSIKKSIDAGYNPILSDENFWNNVEMTTERLTEIRKQLETLGASIKIVVYLRRQDLLLQSYWAQQVKETSTLTFSSYISKGKYKMFRTDYYDRISEFAEVFGKENILVRVYEKQQFKNGNITHDFLQTIGINSTEQFTQSDAVVNISLEGITLEVKRLLNSNSEFKSKQSFILPYLKNVQKSFQEQEGYKKPVYFSSQEQKDFLSQFEECNRKIATEYLSRQDGILFMDTDIIEGDNATNYSASELVACLGEVILLQRQKIDELKEQKNRSAIKSQSKPKDKPKQKKKSLCARVRRKLHI